MSARLIRLWIPLVFWSWAASAAVPPPAADSSAAQVDFFSPTGYSKKVRQVVVRFTVPIVALGDPRLPDPFDIMCSASGKGRWADTRNWVYDFDADLEAGISCRFALKSTLKALNGATLTGQSVFSFNTGGPAILASLPYDGWREIDEEQDFLLRLDAPAAQPSIEANAYCAVGGVIERIPLQVVTGQERRQVLDERRALGYDYLSLLWKSGRRSGLRARNRSMEQDDATLIVVRCQRHLPPATEVLLHWGAGVTTPSGIATQTDQQLAFRVRSAFTAQVECTRTNPRAGCTPVQPIEVNFTAEVPSALALGIRLKAPNGTQFSPRAKQGAQTSPTLDGVSFAGPFPESTTLTVVLPAGLVDDTGRRLTNAARFPLALRVDAYPPLVKFSGSFGILEAKEGGVLPVTLRNVEGVLPVQQASMAGNVMRMPADPQRIADWMKRVDEAARPTGEWRPPTDEEAGETHGLKAKLGNTDEDEVAGSLGRPRAVWHDTTGARSVFSSGDTTFSFTVTRPSGARPEELIGLPLKQPGFYVIEIASDTLGSALLGPNQTRYVSTAALVTDLAVHLKWGREASLVWVTRLSDGQPVASADVNITDVCTGRELWHGQSDADGVAAIGDALGLPPQFGYFGLCRPQTVLMALAKKGEDFSFTESTWNQGITPNDFGVPVGNEMLAGIYHTVLDRSLFRAGETVSMKHFLRRHVSDGMAIPAQSEGAHQIEIFHAGSGQRYELSAAFGPDGVAVNDWNIPSEAKPGDYSVSIDGHPSAVFKVEEFRLPTMHGSVSGPAKPVVAPQQVDVDVHVAYLSGGGAGGMPVKIRSLIEPAPMNFPDYADYEFGGAPVHEGVTTSGGMPYDLDFEPESQRDNARTRTIPLNLDASGSARVTIDQLPKLPGPSRLTAELEYSDANGETLTSTGYVRLVSASVSLGIRGDSWLSPGDLRYRVVALDLNGKPVPGQPITVSLYQSNFYSYRKRLIGGFYSYETTTEVKKLQPQCSGTTNEQGLLLCELTPGVSGQVLVRAETHDEHGTLVGATSSTWVVGKDDWWFGGTSGDRMDVLPEKKEYETGETARFQVRMPFQQATALVTIEREGVLKSFVTTLKGNASMLEVPIEASYAPNVFVSVLALRGRVAHAEPGIKQSSAEELTALVDLNKPAYRLGTTQIKVGWRPHRLEVQVLPERAAYKVRDKANVKIHVVAADGRALPPGSEIALAAVDEALLDLSRNDSWDLLASMMGTRGLEVWTSTAQTQVVGKRHYGRKAIPPGGGGGRELDRARELFDSLLFWQARIALDAQGNASVSIPLNDSLSSFRVVAVAHCGAQLYGTGSATLTTTQDLILLSGLPPLVREGDRYAATFTVRNTSDHTLSARIEAASPQLKPLAGLRADIPPGASQDLRWLVTAPVGVSHLDWDVTARALSGDARDHLKVSEQLIPAFPVRTYQATISQLTAPLSMPVQRPRGAIEGRGGLEVTLQSKLADSLDGVREFMQRYPYICLEQLASRAVALQSEEEWDALMTRLPAYMDEDGLLKYFATERLRGDDTLTAYILAVGNEAGWSLNSADQARLIQALTRFVEGKLQRDSALPTADLSIRKLQAIEALSRYGAAKREMLDTVTLEPNLMPTSALLDWVSILKRMPEIEQRDQKLHETLGLLRTRLNFQGTTMGFSTERSDALWWLMISTDSNANRMLLAVLDQPDWREDIPRLVRGALGRQQFGHWSTTIANAWGVLAMDKFSAAFESTPVSGETSVRYGAEQHDIHWPQTTDSSVVSVPWQSGQGILELNHTGAGAPWSMVRAMAALPLDRPLFTGFKVTRTVTAVEQQRAGVWTRGDVVRVHLELEAQSDMSWVVVDDPVPAGSTVLGSGLGGQSELLQHDNQSTGWVWLAFEERRFEGYRAYYRFVPKGHWSVEYTVRLNNPGTFLLPATRVEAMYAPEMFGEVPNAAVTVQLQSSP